MKRRLARAYDSMTMPDHCSEKIEQVLEMALENQKQGIYVDLRPARMRQRRLGPGQVLGRIAACAAVAVCISAAIPTLKEAWVSPEEDALRQGRVETQTVAAENRENTETKTGIYQDFAYTENENGSITITKYVGTGGDVVVPTTIDGRTVTVLGDNLGDGGVFKDCTEVTSVVVAEGVEMVMDNAFYGCTNLTQLFFPASLKGLGSCAFNDCPSLLAVYFEGDAPQTGNYLFDDNANITIFYNSHTEGWTNPWQGRKTQMLHAASNLEEDFNTDFALYVNLFEPSAEVSLHSDDFKDVAEMLGYNCIEEAGVILVTEPDRPEHYIRAELGEANESGCDIETLVYGYEIGGVRRQVQVTNLNGAPVSAPEYYVDSGSISKGTQVESRGDIRAFLEKEQITADILGKFLGVLSDNEYFYNHSLGKYQLVSGFCEEWSETNSLAVSIRQYAVVDLDGDGVSEVILWLRINEISDYGTLVLRYQDGEIWGFDFAQRQMQDLKQDGTFYISGGGDNDGVRKLVFLDNGWEYVEVQGAVQESKADVVWNDYPCQTHTDLLKKVLGLAQAQERRDIESAVEGFISAYFTGDTEMIRESLADTYSRSVEVYGGPMQQFEVITLTGLPREEKRVGDSLTVSVEFRDYGVTDAYLYLTIGMVKQEDGWKVHFYAIEG